jgi:hypothetical protein
VNKLNCPDCGVDIVYQATTVFTLTAPDTTPDRAKRVYLTCKNGHTHPYEVS